MRFLVVVRHGEYDQRTGRLTAYGQEQAAMLATTLFREVPGQHVRVFSSQLERARNTAAVIAKKYGCEQAHEDDSLIEGLTAPFDGRKILELVSKHAADVDVLVLVTHEPVCGSFPQLFGHSQGFAINKVRLQRGQARIIDMETRSSWVL